MKKCCNRTTRKRPSYLLSILLACVMMANPILANDLGKAPDGGEETAQEQVQTEAETLPAEETQADTDRKADSSAPETNADMSPETDAASKDDEQMATIKGLIRMPDGEAAEDIRVLVYDPAAYEEDDQETAILEVRSEEDGIYEIEDLPVGEYRLEFFSEEEEFDASLYELVPIPEEEAEELAYKIGYAKEEECEYFAYAELTLKEGENDPLEIELQERAEQTNTEEASKGDAEKAEQEAAEKETKEEAEVETKGEAEETSLPTLTDLKELDQETAGATVTTETAQSFFSAVRSVLTGSTWSFDVYYVSENSKYHVDKTDDFSLKYQMEFHTSQELKAGDVEIRIPAILLHYREGSAIYPTEIAVPQGTPENYTETRYSPFNYYYDGDDLVFFNYETIESGSNAAFQVLYSNLKIMSIVDETDWELPAVITVQTVYEEEYQEATPLTGTVDSQVNLTKVAKTPYNNSGMSYTPGLYTQTQVSSYISGVLPDKYVQNFNDYVYVVWDVAVTGNATQPWNMRILDTTTYNNGSDTGEVVGYKKKNTASFDIDETILATGGANDGYLAGIEYNQSKTIAQNFYVVTAYPAAAVVEGELLSNEIDIILEPYDQKDPDQKQSASALWTYKDYVWIYRGDTIGITKSAYPVSFKGWKDVYKEASDAGDDLGDFSYTAISETRGYKLTHYTDPTKPAQLGKPIAGRNYTMTTVDDVLYASSSTDSTLRWMDSKDYYFSSVTITQRDTGYDVWEDRSASPEEAGDLEIWAMYANETGDLGAGGWTKVTTIPWQSDGILSYTFKPEELAREPWRVKAVHNTVNYNTTCTIQVKACIRHDSPVFASLLEDTPEPDTITVQNIAGVMGELFEGYGDEREFQGYYHDQNGEKADDFEYGNTYLNYSEYPDELLTLTKALYNTPLMRASAQVNVSGLNPKAGSYKTATAANDIVNGRVRVNYALTAYDGYEIYGQAGVNYLSAGGKSSPGIKEVVFYDLLPYGVKFDPSVEVVAGRTTNTRKDSYQKNSSLWDRSQVKVTVDSNTDIISDYRGTGRTMVRFHISYEGADPAFYNSDIEDMSMWMQGWGVSFGAYYEWKDADMVSKVPNISAFMPEDGSIPLIGQDYEVYKDDGELPDGLKETYKDFGADINGDGETDVRNVLYAYTSVYENITTAGRSGIEKLVRADSDRFGIYDTSAVVEENGGYTYEITVNNMTETLKDIVVFDRLEHARIDRKIEEPNYDFDEESWHGTFAGIHKGTLEALGIEPEIWYNANRAAALPAQTGQLPGDILTAEEGWYTEAQWVAAGKTLSDVQAFAVDISKKSDGSDFTLEAGQSVSLYVQMLAPDYEALGEAVYAYNNPAFYSYDANRAADVDATVTGNTVKVRLGREKDVEVVKEFVGEVPSVMTAETFEFTAYREENGSEQPWANQEYFLYRQSEDGEWEQAEGLYATDANGCFYLRGGEKAVFPEVPATEYIRIEETESPYWKQSYAQEEDSETIRLWFGNQYRPPLYASKLLASVPEGVDTTNEEFTFRLLINEEPLANADFWYVSNIRTDGGIPNKIKKGTTDENGEFTIKAGEIILLFGGTAGDTYSLQEVGGNGAEDDWFTTTDEVSGTLPVLGISRSITNYYKWKDLLLTKTITSQDPADCTQEFTFQVTDENGKPVVGNDWVLLKDGAETSTKGTLNEAGKFTCACAGAVIKISHLEAGKTYYIQETDSGDEYEALNNGIIEVTMPRFAASESAEIINDYLMRPLSVSKLVQYEEEDPEMTELALEGEFTMTVWVEKGGTLQPLADFPYTVYEDRVMVDDTRKTDAEGKFTIKHNQTAVFTDAGLKGSAFRVTESDHDDFQQGYPLDRAPLEGSLDEASNAVTFINYPNAYKYVGVLMIRKEYDAANAGAGEVIQTFKDDTDWRKEMAVTLTLEVTTPEGETYLWPKEDTSIAVTDELNGDTTEDLIWEAHSTYRLEPWKTITLLEMDNTLTYRLYETSGDQQRLLEWTAGSSWIEVRQQTPENNQAVTGSVADDPVAVLVNEVELIKPSGAAIHKEMRAGSEAVPVGAKLVWRLEEHDGTVWNPKEGVKYLTLDGEGVTCEEVMATGGDGRIILYKTEYDDPWIWFLEESDVKLNYHTGMSQGDLRLVEVIEESDPEWGYLTGYVTEDGETGLHIGADAAVGFVNANQMTTIEIEKQIEDPTDASFTFLLKQVTGTTADPVEAGEDIVSTEIPKGLAYTIHDSETNELLSEGIITAAGEIVIKGGQYARIAVPEGTLWTVSEQVTLPYKLESLSGSPDSKVTKLDDNLMLIHAVTW